MRYWVFVLTLIFLTGCASNGTPPSEIQTDNNPADSAAQEAAPPQPAISLPDLGEAPELTNDVWLNVDQPLRLADLHGKVVLLDMWTFG